MRSLHFLPRLFISWMAYWHLPRTALDTMYQRQKEWSHLVQTSSSGHTWKKREEDIVWRSILLHGNVLLCMIKFCLVCFETFPLFDVFVTICISYCKENQKRPTNSLQSFKCVTVIVNLRFVGPKAAQRAKLWSRDIRSCYFAVHGLFKYER